jgi:methylated-DNA-protein-cysteine methyltransferase-like protein
MVEACVAASHIYVWTVSGMMPKVNDNYQTVYETIRHVPKGKVVTYGEIARLCGFINQARLVGYALRSLPSRSKIPWHRVINSQGRISFPKNSSAYRQQKRLLGTDGIRFSGDKVDLEKYGWLRNIYLEQKIKR